MSTRTPVSRRPGSRGAPMSHRASAAAALGLFIAAGAAILPTPAIGSSHSDAPLIKQDPQTNLTDVYAFVGTKYNDPNTQVLNVIVNVRPFSEPGDGPHYERFAPDARYSIHITDPATGSTLQRYDFQFSAVDQNYKNTGTILSYGLGTEVGPIVTNGDNRQNFTQNYSVTRVVGAASTTLLASGLVAPPNAGSRVTPDYNDADGRAISGATSLATLDSYTRQAITPATSGGATFFCGPRDDSFAADVPGVFNLLDPRILDNDGTLANGLGQDGGGPDGFKGFNVLTYAIQIPLSDLPQLPYNDAFFGAQMGVGVYASVSRQQLTFRNMGNNVQNFGSWVQVNRLGNPLFNEVLVASADKDRYNALTPDADAQFATYAANPEVATLINVVFGTQLATTGRSDLVAVFIPDVLRVATTTGPVRLEGQPGFSRLGFIGGDTTGGISSGWPNGRRLGDDVVDIALTAVASGPTYSAITLVGDNVPENDMAFNAVFPYAATPHSGSFNRKDTPTEFEIADANGDGVITNEDFFAFLTAFENSK